MVCPFACFVYAIKWEYEKQCTEMSGEVKRPLRREDSSISWYSFKSTLATDGTVTSAAAVHNDSIIPIRNVTCVWVRTKGVGPSTTLAWPGWKQPDIPVEVDTARLETSRIDAEVLKKLSLAGIAKLSQLSQQVFSLYLSGFLCVSSRVYWLALNHVSTLLRVVINILIIWYIDW